MMTTIFSLITADYRASKEGQREKNEEA